MSHMRSLPIVLACILALSAGVVAAQTERVEDDDQAPPTTRGAKLTQCPDCSGKVSKRAVMCPHCGCPGEAIWKAVRIAEEAARPKSVVSVITGRILLPVVQKLSAR